ncbi:sterol-binding protein [Yamadazyma tenuis]|uniref:PR-1-like protein n=1 Tax=Candida tenuis (strain ATCC 10573 / BCRC 21748 / CBS 615 / JCM 9827 / NBRC 10315 / NRRL Y-1498 / VKM Y-70) TaxID=590646 RepID=G3B8Y1_CANTC|nr:PR-1-like protein [Yamadazyma tenuis ATCC 10573]EGV62663.1 PR-1-like protein [Yamadazyma tenuis ATCC 10573]WEJ93030.1 sterol-binding protein [Yamadazyma tenuis]
MKVTPLLLITALALWQQAQAAPAPAQTVWRTATQVLNQDGSIFTLLDELFGDDAATTAATTTAATTAAVQAAATTTAASSGSRWSGLLSKLLGYFDDDDTTTAAAAATTTAAVTSVATSAATTAATNDDLFTWFTTANKKTSAATSTSANTLAASSATPTTLSTATIKTGTTVASADASSTEEVSGSDKEFAESILASHNQYRADHNVAALTWNNAAYQYAQNNADNYDCSGVLTHTHGQYGENLAAGFKTGSAAVDAWYAEGSTYDYSSANTYDHFTQVVWKGSTSVGCAYKDCSAENWGLYVVCEYDPPGNVIGENSENVLAADT